MITGSLNQGGAEFQLLSLAKLLKSRGKEIEIFAITDYSYYLPFVEANKIKYSFISNKGNKIVRLIRAVRQIISKKPDLAISYIKRVSQVAILARVFSFFKFKLIISERTAQIKPLHDFYYFNLALLANKVTVNSITKYQYICRIFPLLKKRTVFIPNLLDLEKYLKIKRDLTENGLGRITYVGRISPEKNLLNLIRAVSIVAKRGYKIHLKLFGEANNKVYLNEIQQLVFDSSAEEFIEYPGPVQDVADVFASTDLLCLVSFYEGFSNVLSEGLASGVPIIASNIVENAYLIDNGKNGYLVDPYKPEDIAEGIIKVITLSSEQKAEISQCNINKAIEIFNENQIYGLWSRLIDEVA